MQYHTGFNNTMNTTQQAQNIFLLFAITFLFSSCSFNKIFYKPTKIPASTTKLSFKSAEDSITIIFSGENHQPIFLKNGTDTLHFEYSIESILFKSANGHLLNGWWLKPKNTKATITLLQMHGNGGCLVSQFNAISPLVEKGFQAFIFDYSGFGFSEGKPTRNTVLADAISALDYVQNCEVKKDTKLIIYGQSLGGHLAAVVATKRQNHIDGLVLEGAFSSHKDVANYMIPVLGKIFVKQGYSALKSIKNYHKPLLVIHSTEDKTVPISMGNKIYTNANQPKEFYEVKHCHICATNFYADEIAEKIKLMLNEK